MFPNYRMKSWATFRTSWILLFCLVLGFSSTAYGESSRQMVSEALDLVQQALPETNDQRETTLKQALQLLNNETTHFHGHVGKAMQAIRAALRKIKAGDTYGTAEGDIRHAESQLHTAMSIAT
jgi:cellobiose-specific phosphotransferase system component IIA